MRFTSSTSMIFGEMPPCPGFERAQPQSMDASADDLDDRQTDAHPQLAYLAFTTFTQGDIQPSAFAMMLDEANISALGFVTILEHNTVTPGSQLLLARVASDQYPVFLLMAVAGMGQALGKVSIIGEQDQAFAVDIQSTDRI